MTFVASKPACEAFNGRMCVMCDIDMVSNNTNFKYKCFSDCGEHQWEDDCRTCDPKCRTCFGSDIHRCMSCYEPEWDLHLKATSCIEDCGDGKNMG
jgi:hypothetical protein